MTISRRTLVAAAAAITLATAAAATTCTAFAQATIKIGGIYELSGAGASAGTNFKNGVVLAVKEINEAGASWAGRSSIRLPTPSRTRAWPRA